MLKQAWYTYLMAIHPRNIKQAKGQFDFEFYYMVVLPSFFADESGVERVQFGFLFCTFFIPLQLMRWSNVLSRLHMPKEMFLSPMGMENRKKYMKTVIGIKIGVPVVLCFLLRTFYAMVYGLNPLFVFVSVFVVISFGISMYICSEIRVKRDLLIRYAMRDKEGNAKEAWINWVCMVGSVVLLMVFEVIGVDNQIIGLEWGFFMGGVLFLFLLDILIIKTQFRTTVEDICNYEVRFGVVNDFQIT